MGAFGRLLQSVTPETRQKIKVVSVLLVVLTCTYVYIYLVLNKILYA